MLRVVIKTMNKATIVSIVGKPNVGKSTLFNAIFNTKYAITCHKPQTTRNQMGMVYHFDDDAILFLDTPGFHQAHNKLDEYLNDEIKRSLSLTQVVCFLYDMSRDMSNEDKMILQQISSYDIPHKILVINKAETSKQPLIDAVTAELNQTYHFEHTIQISALHHINIDKFLNLLKGYVSTDVDISFFQEPDDNFIISEIVREQCLWQLKKEIPYGVGIEIITNHYDQASQVLNIDANIIVEKESHKPIVVGKNGQMIKAIGTAARKELLKIYDCKIMLKLFVKVKKDWRDSDYLIKELGYK